MSDRPIDRFLDRLPGGYKQEGGKTNQWMARCPFHEDHDPSMAVAVTSDGDVLFECFAGCDKKSILDAIGLGWPDVFAADRRRRQDDNITLTALAFHKGIPEKWLREVCRVVDADGGGVAIPYRDIDGQVRATKGRNKYKATAKGSSFWYESGTAFAYGMWRLREFRDGRYLIVHEGETSLWALWYCGFPSVGLPGAKMPSKYLTAEIVEGMDRVYLWRDHGNSGREFVAGCCEKLAKLNFAGNVYLLAHEEYDDPSDWFKAVRGPFGNPAEASTKFAAEFREFMDAAPAVTDEDAQAPVDVPPSVAEASPRCQPGRFSLTDAGNGRRFAALHGNDVRFVADSAKWLIWSGCHWERDRLMHVERRAKDVAESIYLEARDAKDDDMRKATLNWASKSEGDQRRTAMIKAASSEEALVVLEECLDADPDLITCESGTIDLRTGALTSPDRNHLITKIIPWRIDFDAPCPIWDNFLRTSMGGDEEMVDYLETALGYSLTGDVSDKSFFFLYGPSGSGKSTLVETVADLFGLYARKTSAETFLLKFRGNTIPNDVARLKGARFVAASELSRGRRLDVAMLKDVTGRDTLLARFLYAEYFQFRPEFKVWMYGNHRPLIDDSDDAIWNRLRLIPFEHSIPKRDQDPQLPDKLKAEYPAILAKLVRAAGKWYQHGLPIPDRIVRANGQYREDMDVFALFIEEACRVGPELDCRSGDIYHAYAKWCEHYQERRLNRADFYQELVSRGFESFHTSDRRGYKGIAPKAVPG